MKRYARRSRARGGVMPTAAQVKSKLQQLNQVAKQLTPFAPLLKNPTMRTQLIKSALAKISGAGRRRARRARGGVAPTKLIDGKTRAQWEQEYLTNASKVVGPAYQRSAFD